MPRILIATNNKDKFTEFEGLLTPFFTCQKADAKAPKPAETGKTYRENALIKAQAFYQTYQIPVLSDDSGIEIDALGALPGVDSAYFGGHEIDWPVRWSHVFQEMKKSGNKSTKAQFRCVLCYFDGTKEYFFEGVTIGEITEEPKGEKGFGYDPIFWSIDLKKTFAEANQKEKGLVSHRGRAAVEFLNWGIKNLKGVT